MTIRTLSTSPALVGPRDRAGVPRSPFADVRLAATRHALRDIDAALLRVEAGT
jgi:hypothetical protein